MPRPPLWSVALCALLISSVVSAQTAPEAAPPPVSGRVVDAETGLPVPSATVRADGTALGTATGLDGWFTLAVPARVATLTVSAVGYGPETVAVPGLAGGPVEVRLAAAASDLQPVVVTAGRGEQARTDAPLAIAALTAADLRETRPNGLAEAVNRVPGVHMVDLGNEQHAMSIRQPFSLKPLFLYLEDGVPIRPAGLFNHNALIEVNQADLERVEVVRGPGSALYGAGAVGGAVNFLTARPTLNPAAALSVRGGAAGYGRADASASGTVGRVGLAGGGYVARQREGPRDHSDYDKASLTVRADAPVGYGTTLVATATANVLDTDTDGSLDSLNYATGGTTSLQTFTYRRVEAVRGAVRLDRIWGARHHTTATVFARANRVAQLPHYRLRPTGPTAATGEVNAQRFRSVGLTAQHEVYPGWRGARLVGGATVDLSPTDYTARFGTATRDADGRYVAFAETDSLLTDYAVRLTNVAAFVQGEVEPVRRVRVVGSVRVDRISFALDNALAPGAFSGAADRTDTFARVTPRLGVVVGAPGGAGLYANASQGFVPPEAGELYRGVQVPTLRPAVFTSVEAGGFAQALGGRLAVDAAVYRMDGRDEIVSVRAADGTTA
ncbi:MAG TPA: TonB-dependent receptor, partial [Rubricoccaceae bacterium]